MQTLSDAIASFRRQIEDSLEQKRGAAGGAGLAWQAERVTLSLEAALGDDGVPRVLAGNAGKGSGGRHTVTVEFRLGSSAGTSAVSELRPPQPVPAGHSTSVGNERVIELLTEILGPPGFDSSARGAVFCDVLRALGPGQEAELPGALVVSAKAMRDENLRRVRHLMRGVAQSGPLKSAERASALLCELFERQRVPALIELVKARWKTGDTWAD